MTWTEAANLRGVKTRWHGPLQLLRASELGYLRLGATGPLAFPVARRSASAGAELQRRPARRSHCTCSTKPNHRACNASDADAAAGAVAGLVRCGNTVSDDRATNMRAVAQARLGDRRRAQAGGRCRRQGIVVAGSPSKVARKSGSRPLPFLANGSWPAGPSTSSPKCLPSFAGIDRSAHWW